MKKKVLMTACVLSVSVLVSGMVNTKSAEETNNYNSTFIKNGRKAAETINKLNNDAFETALEEVLDKYYDDKGNVSAGLCDFSQALD